MTLQVNITFENEDDFARMLGFADMEEAKDSLPDITPEEMILDLHVPWTKNPVVVVIRDEPNERRPHGTQNTRTALLNNHYGIGWTMGILLVYLEDFGWRYFDQDTIEMIKSGFWWWADTVLKPKAIADNEPDYDNFVGACG